MIRFKWFLFQQKLQCLLLDPPVLQNACSVLIGSDRFFAEQGNSRYNSTEIDDIQMCVIIDHNIAPVRFEMTHSFKMRHS